MRAFGWIARSGPSGWDARLQGNEDSIGTLNPSDPLFEMLRQGAELLMSSQGEGTICGSDMPVPVRVDELSRRKITLGLVGVRYHMRWSPAEPDVVRFMVLTPFEFPRYEEGEQG